MCIALVTVTMERRPIARFRLYTGKVLMYEDEAGIYMANAQITKFYN